MLKKNLFSSFHLPLLQHVFFIRAASRIINIQNWFTEHCVRASSNSIVTRYLVTSALMITEMSVVADEMSTALSTHTTFKLHASAKQMWWVFRAIWLNHYTATSPSPPSLTLRWFNFPPQPGLIFWKKKCTATTSNYFIFFF